MANKAYIYLPIYIYFKIYVWINMTTQGYITWGLQMTEFVKYHFTEIRNHDLCFAKQVLYLWATEAVTYNVS